jgi:hypothetical protein
LQYQSAIEQDERPRNPGDIGDPDDDDETHNIFADSHRMSSSSIDYDNDYNRDADADLDADDIHGCRGPVSLRTGTAASPLEHNVDNYPATRLWLPPRRDSLTIGQFNAWV